MFYVGVDLGQKRDHTAIVVVEKLEAHRPWNSVEFLGMRVRLAERWKKGCRWWPDLLLSYWPCLVCGYFHEL